MLKDKHYYVFKKSLDAYFCMDGRVQIARDSIIRYDEFNDSIFFLKSKKYLTYEAVQFVKSFSDKYLDDITELFEKKCNYQK